MTQITHPELVAALAKAGAEIAEQMTANEADLWHHGTGVAGEATELLEALFDHQFLGMDLDRENVVEELGDLEFYLQGVRANLGIARPLPVFAEGHPLNSLAYTGGRLSIQCGNLLDLCKKVAIYKKPADLVIFTKTLGLIEVLLEELRQLADITREETLDGNIAKLSIRYAGLTYSNQAAQVRADKQGN